MGFMEESRLFRFVECGGAVIVMGGGGFAKSDMLSACDWELSSTPEPLKLCTENPGGKLARPYLSVPECWTGRGGAMFEAGPVVGAG